MKIRSLLWGTLFCCLLAGAGVSGYVWWQRKGPPPPQPPVVDLTHVNDPELAQVVEKIRQGVVREPSSAEAWGKFGKLLLANGFQDEALLCFEQAERLAPTEARWPYFQGLTQRLNNLDAAVSCFRRAAQLTPAADSTSFAVRLRYAEALLLAGNPTEAQPLLEELLRAEPDNPRVQLALGSLALDANDLQTSRAHLLRCVKDPLTRQRAATLLATLSLREGDSATAERHRKRGRRLPKDPEAPDPFVEDYQAFLVGRDARFLHAEYLLRGGETLQAIAQLQALTAAYPEAVEAQVKLGMALAEVRNYQRAESVLRQALSVRPDMVQAHYFLCVVLFHQAEANEARSGFQAAAEEARQTIALKPDHAYAHLYLGLALRKLNQPEAVLKELRQAVRLSPETTDPHLHLGQWLLENGHKEEGLAQLAKAVELAGEDDPRPQEARKKWRQPPR